MAVFHMPIVLQIEADSLEDAQKVIDDWIVEIDIDDDLPAGTEDIDGSPNCEYGEDGHKVLYLPTEKIEVIDDELVGEDDFNNDELDF